MMAVTTYDGFELKPNQKLLMEFTDTRLGGPVGRIVYLLDEEMASYYGVGREGDADILEIHGIEPGDDVNIADTLGFMLDGGEHTHPDKLTELAADENPVSIDGLSRIEWNDLKPGMTVVWETPEAIVEATLPEDFDAEDGVLYAFGLTLSGEFDTVYLKDTPEGTTISLQTSDEVGCEDDHKKGVS